MTDRTTVPDTPDTCTPDIGQDTLHLYGGVSALSVLPVKWQPLKHPPRRIWVGCIQCRFSTINEDRHLRGWEESVTTPRSYRCASCASPPEAA